MKQVFLKITSFLLALLVCLSTFSFTVEKHYCGDFLVDVSFIGAAASCGMENGAVIKKNCCKDEIHQIEGQHELLQASIDDFNFQKQQSLVSFSVFCRDLFIVNESTELAYNDLCPPDLPKNYRVLYQSFLI
jgi:hypothetical protein